MDKIINQNILLEVNHKLEENPERVLEKGLEKTQRILSHNPNCQYTQEWQKGILEGKETVLKMLNSECTGLTTSQPFSLVLD